MPARSEILLILGMALVTFPVRLSVIALVGEGGLPDGLARARRSSAQKK